jgi:hypothetical protein
MLCLSSTLVAAQNTPPEALHFPKEEFDAFVSLSETEFDTQAQWDAWANDHQGHSQLPSESGNYLVYTNDSIHGPYNVFFGPFEVLPIFQRDRLSTRVKASAQRRPSLLDAQVRMVTPEQLTRIEQLGLDNWARSEAMANERSHRAITQLDREVADRELTEIDRLQLLAARNAKLLDVAPTGVLGQTLDADQTVALDRELGRYVVLEAYPTFDVESVKRNGIDAITVEALYLSLSNTMTEKTSPAWSWIDDSSAGWADTELRAALYPSGTPESLSPEQADIAVRAIGRLLPATAAQRWRLSPSQILSDTPSQRELERVADRLQRHGSAEAAKVIQETLSDAGPSLPDSKDLGAAFIERFYLGASYQHIPDQDVNDGKEALARASQNLENLEIDPDDLDKWVKDGATHEEVQQIADVAQKLIGDLPTIQAIGQSARSTKRKQNDDSEGWSPEEVRDLVGRIGEAERQARTAEALDEETEGDFEIADAATNGVTASDRQALAQALGEAAGAPPADAEAKGEELLEQADADPAGGVSNEQVADAAEAAAAEGGHSASGEPGDANDGGKGDRGGSGAIPVQSLPVLEVIARLLAQYFGVEAYLKQAALLIYMFAGDLVDDLVAKLEGINKAFGDDLNELAADVNKLLDAMGPYMGDIGALADQAVEQGLEKATSALADLAAQEFEDATIEELKRQIAAEIGVDPSMVDLEGALSMASDFSMEKLTELAETAVEDAARDAAVDLLTDAGLPTDVLDTKNWDAAGEMVIESLKNKATSEVSRQLGLEGNLAESITKAANAGDWDAVGTQLVEHGRERAIDIAAQESGLPRDVLSNPSGAPDKLNQVVNEAGAVALLLGDETPDSTRELMTLADEPETLIERVRDRELEVLRKRNPGIGGSIDAYQANGLQSALNAAKADAENRLRTQTASLENAVALAARSDPDEILDQAITELQAKGTAGINETIAQAIQEAADPSEALNEQVFDWAGRRFRLQFETDKPCRSAIDSNDVPMIQSACTQWLAQNYEGSDGSIEARLAADPHLIQRVTQVGDRSALAQALMQYAIRVDGNLPTELEGSGWQTVGESGLTGAITQWSEASAAELEDELKGATETEGLADILNAVQNGDFDAAANEVFEHRGSKTLVNRMPDSVQTALADIDDTDLLVTTIASELREHARQTGQDALRKDPEFGSVADVAQCVGSAEEDCGELTETLTTRALDVGLSNQNADLRQAIISSDPVLAAGSQRTEIEASIKLALDGESITAAACYPTNDPGCVFRETQLIPQLRTQFPDLSESAARDLVEDPTLSLPELKGFADGALSDDAILSELGTNRDSMQRFASTPSVLNDPDAQHQLKQALLAESLSTVVGEDASRALLTRMAQKKDAPAEGHCVDVFVRAFIPSAALSQNNPIVPVPGKADQWMIPGPLAEISGYGPPPLSTKARAELGEPSPAMLRTCYVGDNRSYSSDPKATSRVWLNFSMRVGETAFELDPSSVKKGTHRSYAVHCETGEALEDAKADTNAVSVEALPASEGVAGAKIKLAGRNPLIPAVFSPLLELEGTFTYSRDDLTVSFDGKREAFPAYEAYARLNGGDWRTVFATGPDKGASAFSIADYGVLKTMSPFQSSVTLPGLSSSCRAPQDEARRHALRRAAAAAFKASNNHCVTFTEVMKMAAADAPDLLTYLEDLRLVLIGSDILRENDRRGPFYIGTGLTNDSGFKEEFLDSSPQVEHAMWGVYAGKGFLSLPGVVGAGGVVLETFQGVRRLLGVAMEEDGYQGMTASDVIKDVYADSALYAVAGDFSERLTTANYADSYRDARKRFCAAP